MSLQYRKERMRQLSEAWGGELVRDLFVRWKIPPALFEKLRLAICMYVAQAMYFDFQVNECSYLKSLNANRHRRENITPNGAVVPKKEYQLEYNLFLKVWCEIVREMTKQNPNLLNKFRLTPNIRIKFGEELGENIGRPLDTALPHSDAWVEGPWGMNCHLPILGDITNNYLHFYKLRDEATFSESFLEKASTYKEMSWVLNEYVDDDLIPEAGYVNISDYALIHKTLRNSGCDARISIDTTIFTGDHEVHPDREAEYLDSIPKIGEELFVTTVLSSGEIEAKKTTFSHYTTGNLKHISLI